MSNEEKFRAFKEKTIAENEALYGEEIREKFGDDALATTNSKVRGLSQTDYQNMQRLEQQLFDLLKEGVKSTDPSGQVSSEITNTHKQWLLYTWQSYSAEAHKGLASLYLADPRFKSYYDNIVSGGAQFLHDAIQLHAK